MQIRSIFAMQKHSKIRNVPVSDAARELRCRIPQKAKNGTRLIQGHVPVLCCILSKDVVCLYMVLPVSR